MSLLHRLPPTEVPGCILHYLSNGLWRFALHLLSVIDTKTNYLSSNPTGSSLHYQVTSILISVTFKIPRLGLSLENLSRIFSRFLHFTDWIPSGLGEECSLLFLLVCFLPFRLIVMKATSTIDYTFFTGTFHLDTVFRFNLFLFRFLEQYRVTTY